MIDWNQRAAPVPQELTMPSPSPITTAAPSMHDDLVLIGPIVRLQVQVAHLKHGERPLRWYVPDGIAPVAALHLDPGGVVGFDGDHILNDVHHRDHAISRYRGENGVSVGFTGHYDTMRAQYGDFLHDGIAGENILVASDTMHAEDEFHGGIVIATADGMVELTEVQVAPPCVEFGKFCLRYPNDRRADAHVAEAVKFLHEGRRGFYATWLQPEEQPHSPRLTLGDLVYRRVDPSEAR